MGKNVRDELVCLTIPVDEATAGPVAQHNQKGYRKYKYTKATEVEVERQPKKHIREQI
jgi:hypothetical protein